MLSTLVALSAIAQNSATIPEPVLADWWQNRHNAVLNRVRKGNVDLVFIGDSITHAFGGEPDTQQDYSNRGGDTWNLFYGYRKAVNLGFSGDRTQNVLWRISNGELDGIKPKVFVVMIGTNNIGAHGPTSIAEGIFAICKKAKEKCPRAKQLVLGIFPRGTADSTDRERVIATNQILEQQAVKKGYEFLDIGTTFLDSRSEIPDEVMPDLLHPFQLGYRQWAMAMEPTLAKLLNEKPKTTLDPRNSAVVPITHNRDFPLYDWMPRHNAVLNHHRLVKPDVVMIGDSIIHYFGGPPTDDKHLRGVEVWNSAFAGLAVSNLGFGWDGTENVLWRLEQGELSGIAPKAVVLLIGTNNLEFNSAPEIRDGIQAVVELIRQKQPKAWIVLLGILPRGQEPTNPMRARLREVNRLIEPLGKLKNVVYKDLGPALLEPDGSISKETMSDFLHPTAGGYSRMAEALMPVLRSVLE